MPLAAGRAAQGQPGTAGAAGGAEEQAIALVLQVQPRSAILPNAETPEVDRGGLDAQPRSRQDVGRQGIEEAIQSAVIVRVAGGLVRNARQVEPADAEKKVLEVTLAEQADGGGPVLVAGPG